MERLLYREKKGKKKVLYSAFGLRQCCFLSSSSFVLLSVEGGRSTPPGGASGLPVVLHKAASVQFVFVSSERFHLLFYFFWLRLL